MSFDLRNRNFLKLDDFTTQEIRYLLQLSAELKAAKKAGTEIQHLKGKQIALIFEKDSTRTRCAFEVAATDQGAHVTYLGPSGSHIGYKESMKDTARVLGRMYDGIEYRGALQTKAEELSRFAGVPVWNGMTNEAHPTQILADLLTMQESAQKPLKDIAFCFLGNVSYNVADSLLIAAVKLGMDIRLAGPKQTWPSKHRLHEINSIVKATGAHTLLTENAEDAVRGCDFLYTDVWVSMGEDAKLWGERIQQMLPYQVNSQLMALTHNPDTKFLHCLPALHNTETKLGQEIFEQYGLEALEVTNEVFESPASLVFDQAENRLHTAKAVMVATLA